MSIERVKEILLQLQQEDYPTFVKALISSEYHIEDEVRLEKYYQHFMQQDSMTLLNEQFEEMIQRDE